MIDVSKLTTAELAAYIQEALRSEGISVVLSGGSCVTVWGNNAYRSDDIDLIPEGLPKWSTVKQVMQELGFAKRNRYFAHPECPLWVEFPEGPLGVGNEPPRAIDSRNERTGTLRLLSPTDCVKDRLTWYYHDDDRQALEQAVTVAERHPIDIDELRRWSRGEGKKEEFERIVGRLGG